MVRAFAHGAMGCQINGPMELFLIPASAPQLDPQRSWYALSCLWDGVSKIPLANN